MKVTSQIGGVGGWQWAFKGDQKCAKSFLHGSGQKTFQKTQKTSPFFRESLDTWHMLHLLSKRFLAIDPQTNMIVATPPPGGKDTLGVSGLPSSGCHRGMIHDSCTCYISASFSQSLPQKESTQTTLTDKPGPRSLAKKSPATFFQPGPRFDFICAGLR